VSVSIESVVSEALDQAFDKISSVVNDSYLRDAVGKMVVREVVHRSIEDFGMLSSEMADHLQVLSGVVSSPDYGRGEDQG